MHRRAILAILTGVCLAAGVTASGPARALDQNAAATFVDEVARDVLTSLGGKKLSIDERNRVVNGLFDRYVDVPQTSQDILGRYWARASAEEQAKFQTILIQYVLSVWGNALGDIAPGQKITVTRSEPAGDRVTVHALSTEPGEDPTPVEFLVGAAADGRLKVLDVRAVGVSPIQTMRDDFASFLRTNGGQVGLLIAAMQKKIDSAVAAK